MMPSKTKLLSSFGLRLIQLSRIRRMCRLLVDCDMNTPTKKALEAGIAPNAADMRSVVGMVGGGEKTVVQVRRAV